MKTLTLLLASLTLVACGAPSPQYEESCQFNRAIAEGGTRAQWVELEKAASLIRRDDERVAVQRAIAALRAAYAADPGLTCSFTCVSDCEGATEAIESTP